MTVEEKVWKLAHLLHKKTAAGQVKWEQTAQKYTFLTAFPKHAVRIGVDPKSGRYVLSIVDETGTIVEQATDESIAETVMPLDESTFVFMGDLYTMARRSAVGADAALDELIAELS